MAEDYAKNADEALTSLDSQYKNLSTEQFAEKAMITATQQLMASTGFKKPRLATLAKRWELYDGKTTKKLRQLFNVPIPVFPGMIDTLNALYDTPVLLSFGEGDPSDYFKVQKVEGAWRMEVMDTAENSKWDSKLSMARKHAIMNGIAIPKLTSESDPEYKSTLDIVNLKNFHFQPRGGGQLENHLFSGEEDIEKTQAELKQGALAGFYKKSQVQSLLRNASDKAYLPQKSADYADRLSRFKPLGLDPDNNSFVGQAVHRLCQWILEIDGKRFYICWDPWTQTWLRFERWSEQCSSDLYPWVPYQTHEDDENLLSKAFSDDLYAAADAIVAMFNQELTNREKRNAGARAYDKDMFQDVRKLDEAQHRPDALVPADTKGGTKRIAEGIYKFETAELNGTVNLIDWLQGNLGKNTGATDMAQGAVTDTNKKASVAFAEQKSVSKRIAWSSRPFQTMMAGLGKRYLVGLKDDMPSKMAIRLMGDQGWDWDEITRLDLNTHKDIDIRIISTDQQKQDNELRAERRKEALIALAASPNINSKKRDEELLRIAEYSDQEIAEFMDVQTYSDKKSLAKAAEAIQLIIRGKSPDLWYGATIAFMQKIVDFATDKRATLKDKYQALLQYSSAHEQIVKGNLERKVAEQSRIMAQQQMTTGGILPEKPAPKGNTGVPPGISHAMNVAGV